MDENDEGFHIHPDKDPTAGSPKQSQDAAFMTPADYREEECELSSYELGLAMSREEDEVQLYPRFDASFDCNDHDQCVSDYLGTSAEKLILRDASPPPFIPDLSESSKREKPYLCRSLAWSQDSLDERRVIKRCRTEEKVPSGLSDAYAFSGFQRSRQPRGTDNSTAIHWEEKIIDSMELISFLDRALTS